MWKITYRSFNIFLITTSTSPNILKWIKTGLKGLNLNKIFEKTIILATSDGKMFGTC